MLKRGRAGRVVHPAGDMSLDRKKKKRERTMFLQTVVIVGEIPTLVHPPE